MKVGGHVVQMQPTIIIYFGTARNVHATETEFHKCQQTVTNCYYMRCPDNVQEYYLLEGRKRVQPDNQHFLQRKMQSEKCKGLWSGTLAH